MKTNLLASSIASGLLFAFSAWAQSTFVLENFNSFVNLDAPVFDAKGDRLTGTNYAAELWGGDASDSLTPTVDFRSGERVVITFGAESAAGYFFSTASMTVWDVPGGGYAWLELRAWDARLGTTYEEVLALGIGGYAESTPFFAMGGDPLGVPPTAPRPLIGLESFSLRPIIPEPVAGLLLLLGLPLLLRRSRHSKREVLTE